MTKERKIKLVRELADSLINEKDFNSYVIGRSEYIREDIKKNPENKKIIGQIKELITGFNTDEELYNYIMENCPRTKMYIEMIAIISDIEEAI